MKKLLCALCLLALLAACSIDNTMYNARSYFKSAKARPLNANGRPSPQAVADYTKSIEKCGIILTERRNSKDADDALFLMAKALYYKGNSAFQAKEQFENLIKVFPDSPFVPEAYIYLGRINREINRAKEAETLLEEFVRNPNYRKHHPRALLVLTEFEISDTDYHRAQYWLEKLLNEYPKTPEYNEAFFLFGKNYFVQKEYAKSLAEFEKLTNLRGVAKDLKLEANYFIAQNLYYLGEYSKGYRIVRSLINSEYRTERVALARVLKARFQLAMGNSEDAISEFEYVNKTYPRTAASAEAFFYMAENQFYRQNRLSDAVTTYNRVRSEFANSELSPLAQSKATAITQLNQARNLNSETDMQQFLDYHFLAADNYLKPLALPDSTLLMYKRVLQERDRFSALLDSLGTKQFELSIAIDSLTVFQAGVAVLDSTDIDLELTETAESDSLSPESPKADENRELETRLTQLRAQDTGLTARIENIEAHLERYDTEIIPFTHFVLASFYKRQLQADAKVDSILAYLNENYQDNKYTNAVRQLSLGQSIRLIDSRQDAAEKKLDYAFGLAATAPDSMRVLLSEIIEGDFPPLILKANFRMGWHYTFEVQDTTEAKPYLDQVLSASDSGDYGALVRRFYGGNKFLFAQIAAELVSLAAAIDSLMVLDPLSEETTPEEDEEQFDINENEAIPPSDAEKSEAIIEAEHPSEESPAPPLDMPLLSE